MPTRPFTAPTRRASAIRRAAAPRLAALAALLAAPALALAAGVSVRFDVASATGSPFPSDVFTQPDWSNNTGKRVSLPLPDCAARPSDCADAAVINTLDGFNTQPRVTVPFSGDIDLSTVNSNTVYFVSLGDTLSGAGAGHKVGINQVSWDVAAKTLVFESDELLAEHARYVLVVTDGVRDSAGDAVEAGDFGRFRKELNYGQTKDRALADYRKALLDAQNAPGVPRQHVVALSLFTTQSVSADLLKIHAQIQASNPAPATFMIGNGGSVRAVFPTATLQGIQWSAQTGAAPSFTTSLVPTTALGVYPGAVASVAFGRFRSPDYENAAKVIPTTGTLTGTPAAQGHNDLVFELFVPSGPRPAGGWPVAIFGHGFTDSMYGAPWTVASTFAHYGVATMAISVVGHGYGALGTLNVMQAGAAPVVVPSGGRGFDQDGNGTIDSTEGVSAVGALSIVSSRDGLRQTVADLMQLVREVQVGVDVDGDGQADLDANRIYYAGQSFGGIYGVDFLALEPDVLAGVPNVPGGPITEIARLSPVFRPLVGISLLFRTPSLYNAVPNANLTSFVENMPLRDLPALVDTVPGASAIQAFLDRNIWVQQSANPAALAPYVRAEPLPGHPAKAVIVQFAKGDMTVPNPTASAILRAGGLADRATYFRNDIAGPGGTQLYGNPHTFLTGIGNPATATVALEAQAQMATFLATGGAVTIDPDGPGPVFETPIAGPLPEVLNFP